MVSSGIPSLDAILDGDGYPPTSTVSLVGAPGVGKEALGYWFTRSGVLTGDSCLYITRLPAKDVLRDAKAFGVDYEDKPPILMASSGGQLEYDPSSLAEVSFKVWEFLQKNIDRHVRIVIWTLMVGSMLVASSFVLYAVFATGLSIFAQASLPSVGEPDILGFLSLALPIIAGGIYVPIAAFRSRDPTLRRHLVWFG